MSTMMGPALQHMVFATALLVWISMMGVDDSSEMYEAVVRRFRDSPFRLNPDKTLVEVQGGLQVYEWLTNVFVRQLYAEQPQPGDIKGYCTSRTTCMLGQGQVTATSECAKHLVAGTNNCPMHLGSGTDCCQPCVGEACGLAEVWVGDRNLTSNTSVPDLSVACSAEIADWMTDLREWSRDGAPAATASPSTAPVNTFTYCPERQSNVEADLDTQVHPQVRDLMVAQYNLVLMGRMTLKRVGIVPHESTDFQNAYTEMMAGTFTSSEVNSDKEDKSEFGVTTRYTYEEEGGYAGAGGFVQYLDFAKSKYEVTKTLAALQANNWFDLKQGSFALEMLLYNGNIDQFLYVTFRFEHDFSGMTETKLFAYTLDLTLHYMGLPATWLRFWVYLVVVSLFCLFCKNELDELSSDPTGYLSDPMSLVQLVSLSMFAYCTVEYVKIVFSHTFFSFDLPFPPDEDLKFEEYDALVSLSMRMHHFMFVLSVSTCLSFIRCITLLTTLAPQTGIVFNTISQVKNNVIAFCVMLIIMLFAFTFCGFYIFGSRSWNFSSVGLSFLTTAKMIMREANLESLRKHQPLLGPLFFAVFHMFFLIVQQIMLSILIEGYEKERERIDRMPESDRYPLKRIWRTTIKPYIRHYSMRLMRCAVFLKQILFGSHGGGTVRVNYEHVAKLRDRRATKPRRRTVQYEQKKDDQDASNVDMEDVILKPIQPVYPDGMMHFEVESIKKDGPAEDYNVMEGFCLVAITNGGTEDREVFRKKDDFDKKPKLDADGHVLTTTERVLHKCRLPLTLEFEGSVKPISLECGGLMFFTMIFLVFVMQVSRVHDSFNQFKAHHNAVVQPEWYGYNPTRLMSFDKLETMAMMEKWMRATILDKEYQCFNALDGQGGCESSNFKTTSRSGWGLWAGTDPPEWTSKRGSSPLSCKTTPAAVNGLSLGYIPRLDQCMDHVDCGGDEWTPGKCDACNSADADPLCPPEISEGSRLSEYNVAAMPNNHVRLTFQVACFKENEEGRFKSSYKYVIHPQLKRRSCAGQTCMKDMWVAHDGDEVCLDSLGVPRQYTVLRGEASDIAYTFTDSGTYRDMGGIAVGLGSTQQEAAEVLRILSEDKMFMQNAVSFVLEFVSFNGNYDMFTYTTVLFSLKATGKLEKEFQTSVFPLNAMSMGVQDHVQGEATGNWVAFALYIFCFLFFTANLLHDFNVQYEITVALQRSRYMTFVDFFTEDWWNILDVVLVCLNIEVIMNFINYLLFDATIVGLRPGGGLRSFTVDWMYPNYATLAQQDPIAQFEAIAVIYQRFSGLAAVNGLFLMIRFIKYFGGISALRLVLVTLSSAFAELIIIAIILCFILIGFVFMFFIRFGVQISRFGTLYESFCNLFMFLVGRFDIDDLVIIDPEFFWFIFPMYQIMFFLLLNMFLAAICYRWKESRKDARDFSIVRIIGSLLRKTTGALSCCRGGATAAFGEGGLLLNSDFWQELSVLRHLGNLDENGKIVLPDDEHANGKDHGDGPNSKVGRKADASDEDERSSEELRMVSAGDAEEIEEEQQKFVKAFMKAHMEIASQMCRTLAPVVSHDQGAGVGLDLDELGPGSRNATLTDEARQESDLALLEDDPLGIIEEPVRREDADQIRAALTKMIDVSKEEGEEERGAAHATLSPAEEIWLDALVTVLEEAKGLEQLQKFFLPLPMIEPKKPQEKGMFQQRKRKMQQRLDLFLQWLREVARTKHYDYLRLMAESKERVLKQQSLVLTDYLETLDQQIEQLQEQIKDLERKNAQMRSHVSPLL